MVDLNTTRAAEEARGVIRWLRPEYQNPSATTAPQQAEVELVRGVEAAAKPKSKPAWPKNMREQVAAVRNALQAASMTGLDIAQQFKRSPIVAVQSVLDALQDLGLVEVIEGRYRIQS